MRSAFLLLASGALLGAAASAGAQPVEIRRGFLGSGEPGQGTGFQNADVVDNDIYHAPQYLPGHPTAATIHPRVIEVPCRPAAGVLRCDGYEWQPAYGRAEYLYFKPVVVAQAPAAEGGGRSEPAAVLPPAPAPAAVPPVQAAPARPPVRAPHAPGPRVRRDRS